MPTANDLINVAQKEVGYSRWTDPEKGTKYGRWYESEIDRCVTNYDFGANGVAYCAMFVSWCLSKAGVTCAGFPGAYCPSIHLKQNLTASQLRRGDIVLFDWENDKTDDHVGIVLTNSGSSITTIEGNTNNSAVANRTRSYGTICGGIRPNYDGTNNEPQNADALAVDGVWGCATTSALQTSLGTTVDGVVSDQYIEYRLDNPGLSISSWQWHSRTTLGSDMVRALQRKVGANVDGIAGSKTFRAFQSYLGTTVDGCVSNPSDCVKELQRRLNAGKF